MCLVDDDDFVVYARHRSDNDIRIFNRCSIQLIFTNFEFTLRVERPANFSLYEGVIVLSFRFTKILRCGCTSIVFLFHLPNLVGSSVNIYFLKSRVVYSCCIASIGFVNKSLLRFSR